MISFDQAMRHIADVARPIGSETVPLSRAAGRTLSAAVVAQVDSPPADCSAMDGYAVREADLPGSLRVMGKSFAGRGFDRPLEPGCAVRIFTGAPVPHGADRVIIQERAEPAGDRVIVPLLTDEASHIRRRGSDFRAGQALLGAGTVLTPRALVAAAAADRGEVDVWRKPRVVVLATGDELAQPGQARDRPGAIPESVSYGVAALVNQSGGQTVAIRRLGDNIEDLERAAGEALADADLIVVTGGASVGEKDFAKRMFEMHGLELLFSKVAIKPGKPIWLGRARERLILGLPGNPTSAMVTARLMLVPLVTGISGGSPAHAWEDLPLAGDLAPCGERETFTRGRWTAAGVVPLHNQDSSAQHALVEADYLIRSLPHCPVRRVGETIQALSF
ncbi:molybdopterin molybdotransferase MoeA [Tsuneonella troitsensis]|uniref:molybdopterin molybdotransferase MoeA n=1 Tax=Tsuneonella troitsensis TaxID=292222 RepID=UPI00070DA089|nr:molybdopterin molybdotransferase MoeA [Tsuneonella troitsensis]